MSNRTGYAVGLFALLLALVRCGSSPAFSNSDGPSIGTGGDGFSGTSNGGHDNSGSGSGNSLNVGDDGGTGDTGSIGDGGCSGASCGTPEPAVCGDGVVDNGEGCDDGNHT